MNDWTFRTRIIAAFATIITIMFALGAVSFVQLGDIRTQALLLQSDVLPGLLLSSHASARARLLLPEMVTQATGTDEREKLRARDLVERTLADAVLGEQRYRPTITTENDQRMFEAMVLTRTRVGEAYAAALRDNSLDANEVNSQLRPVLDLYTSAADSLVDLNRRAGEADVTAILH